jgi:hypothetical protein
VQPHDRTKLTISLVPMPTANLVRDRYTTSINKGRGELDWSALAIEVFEAAGLD